MTFREYRTRLTGIWRDFFGDMSIQTTDIAKELRMMGKFVRSLVVALFLIIVYCAVLSVPIIIMGGVFGMGKFMTLLIGIPCMMGLIVLTAPFLEPVLDWYWNHILN